MRIASWGFAALLVLAGCGPVVTGPQDGRGQQGGFARAAQKAAALCVAHGPSFAGTAAAVRSAGGVEVERGADRVGYRLPDGDTLSVNTASPIAQCVIYTESARSYAEIGAAMAGQPGLVPVPGVAGNIALPGQAPVAFPNSWRVPSKGLVVRVNPILGGLTTIIVEDVRSGALNMSHSGLTAPVIVR